ncbi:MULTISPECIES: ABC transporter permease [Acidocella]|uniref:ABC transporter permease n=1 Tax=Acidocella TaxID=50709 RepID=UPI00028E2C5F|nr:MULTISPECIES: ABC transporter permease [Acidocella]EKM98557.1 sugar ABC transporter permease [Acidocella sp. MX-AZ02]WBO59061.1 ABC transporter permease [Acidocella sp. MX-AZ03]
MKSLPTSLTPGVAARRGFTWRVLRRWESLLALTVLADVFLNTRLSPYFLNPWTLSDASFNFTERGIMALPMALLIIAGEIDISVGSTMAMSSVFMGLVAQAGGNTALVCLTGLLAGALAGAGNGLLVTYFRVPSIVATIGTLSLYRGIAYAILGDGVLKSYSNAFAWFGQGYVWGPVSFELVLFLGLAVIFGIVLHFTVLGRRIYAIGANAVAARLAGVQVGRTKFGLFVLLGTCAGLASILLTSRQGSTRPSLGLGWELDVITMVILGGVAIDGGQGSIIGVVLAALLIGMVTFGLSLLNVPGIVLAIITGGMLLGVVALSAQLGPARRRR